MEVSNMAHPHLINILDRENCVSATNGFYPDGEVMEEQRTLTMPEGENRLFCFTDSIMHPAKGETDEAVGLHEHHQGYETFFVESGGLDFYIDGKKTRVNKGNIIHIQPYEAHGMIFRDHTIYRGAFHNWNCVDDTAATTLLETHYPDAKKDPDFFALLIKNIDMYMRERADFVETPVTEVSAIRNPDRPMARFDLDGVTLKMLTARWENGGVNELWRAELDKGFHAEWDAFPETPELYYVVEGAIKFKVYDEEFTAGPDSIVKIPKYAPHSIVALEKSALYDLGGTTQWFALLQDRASILKFDPERAKDPATKAALKEKFGCQIKSFGIN
jgi:mannose-6-phosphate isomerase-like protein (cupin superfamily)